MNPTQLEVLGQADHPPDLPYRWLPIVAVEPGMVIARPVVGLSGVRETMYVAIGSTVTVNTIAQMIVKGVECVAVFDTSAQGFPDGAQSVAKFETRLKEIFGAEPDDACRALMDALIVARPVLC